MMIDQVCPEMVEAKSTLREKLMESAMMLGLSADAAVQRLASVPAPLINAGAFFDKMTKLWRYEFGVPFEIGGKLVWGTHMWTPVNELHMAICAANMHLSNEKRLAYFDRLNSPGVHAITLSEMIPGERIRLGVAAEFEVSGYGVGNRTVDWAFHPEGRTVLLDVKHRSADFIQQIGQIEGHTIAPPPDHDPALLFKSVEKKFASADPNVVLQGAWVATHVQQSEASLNKAFASLDPDKVHFAVLGDWRADVHLLVRREVDRPYLLELFTATRSDRFTFAP